MRKIGFYWMLSSAFVLLLIVTYASAGAETYNYVSSIGSYGSGDGQFSQPYGIDIDASGYIYVADTYNNRIQKFSSSGTYTTQWGSSGTGNGQFQQPYSVAVDTSGNVYVADTVNNRIQKFSADGTYVTQWGSSGTGNGQFQQPYSVAVDTSGNVYVADTTNDRIQKFSSDGTYITQWGSSGTGNGQFSIPYGIAVDTSGNVYVADSYDNRIQKFSSDGTYITQWGSFGTGNGQFKIPYGIAVDTSGNVYVADTVNNRIQKFSSDSSEEDKKSCYIATAAYGSYLDPHVWVLRDFRDKYLVPYSAGSTLLDIYYRHSPPIADFIRDKKGLKWIVRLVITPLVYAIEYPFAAIFVLFPPAFLLFRKWNGRWSRKRRRSRPLSWREPSSGERSGWWADR